MKKTLIALALAVPAMAGTISPVVVAPNPETVPAPVVTPSPWAVEIGGVYRWATKDIAKGADEDVDVWGGEITGIYKLTENHAITLRFGYNGGDVEETTTYEYWPEMDFDQQPMNDGYANDYPNKRPEYPAEYSRDKDKVEVSSLYLMPGYRYTGAICDSVSWYVGANVGIAYTKAKYSWSEFASVDGDQYHEDSGKISDKDWGLAASAEIGLQYHITDSVYLFGAYQYWASTAQPEKDGYKMKKQHYHTVNAGVGINF